MNLAYNIFSVALFQAKLALLEALATLAKVSQLLKVLQKNILCNKRALCPRLVPGQCRGFYSAGAHLESRDRNMLSRRGVGDIPATERSCVCGAHPGLQDYRHPGGSLATTPL